MRTMVLALALLGGCDGGGNGTDGKDPGDDTDVAGDDTDGAGDDTDAAGDDTDGAGDDTDPPVARWTPASALIVVDIAYDAATDAAVAYEVGGTPTDSTMYLVLGSEAWESDFEDEDNYCVFALYRIGPTPRATWLQDPVFWGFDFGADAVAQSNCGEKVDAGPVGDVDAALAALDWSFGYLPMVFPSFADVLVRAGVLQPADFNSLLGGGAAGSIGAAQGNPPFLTTALVNGFQVDGDFRVVEDANGDWIPMTRAEMATEAGMATGYYSMQVFLSWAELAMVLDPA